MVINIDYDLESKFQEDNIQALTCKIYIEMMSGGACINSMSFREMAEDVYDRARIAAEVYYYMKGKGLEGKDFS
jgi:hypothetical protein